MAYHPAIQQIMVVAASAFSQNYNKINLKLFSSFLCEKAATAFSAF